MTGVFLVCTSPSNIAKTVQIGAFEFEFDDEEIFTVGAQRVHLSTVLALFPVSSIISS